MIIGLLFGLASEMASLLVSVDRLKLFPGSHRLVVDIFPTVAPKT